MKRETYITLDATELAELVRKREVTAEEMVALSFQQQERVNPTLNAVVNSRCDAALTEKPATGAFTGIPLLLKDISQAVDGEPLTSGAKVMAHYKARYDAHFVKTLRESGMIVTGHTNTPEFGLKNITEPVLHGATKNPWNTNYSPGGSSGGSAAAVAAGIVPVAGASDGGGSIRIPASFTSLFGLKPTRGRTPVGPGVGRQWQGAAIDFVLTRTVRDCAAMLQLLQTIQPEAAFQTPLLDKRSFTKQKDRLTIGFSTASPVKTPVSKEAVQAVEKTVSWLAKQGYHVEEAVPKINGEELMRHYYLMNSGEMAGVMMKLGEKITSEDLELESWVLSEAGRHVSAAEFSLSLQAWDTAAATMADFHQRYDIYVTPTTAFPAPKVGELTYSEAETVKFKERLMTEDKQELIYEMFLPSLTYTPYTQLANLTGQPAMSLPLHMTANGLPLGVQMMAQKGREDQLLQLAYLLEESDLWIKAKPAIAQ
ncbi:amidase family protein [Salipaludibacillus sp. LMS25]|jgi:amidase|uniref:amidase family protein n=1 Tax=Salipaludibacillus sp. LMS25 TaxID=2924031 RepID=UPI0020D06E89|nr:amidase family protein [Salipaludibacillus sp. LMS25]UTR13620.1 amidase family protein [Salipaludibacillus sp. LMS25]